VGYSLAGSLAAPDPVNSYFIVQNNWGAGSGREGFFAMSFAYFSFIAEALLANKLRIHEIKQEEVNLETAFMRLTKGIVQ